MEDIIKAFSERVFDLLNERLKSGICTVIDDCDDSIEFIMTNYGSPFHFKLYKVQERISNGETAENVADMICGVYRKHILSLYFKQNKSVS